LPHHPFSEKESREYVPSLDTIPHGRVISYSNVESNIFPVGNKELFIQNVIFCRSVITFYPIVWGEKNRKKS
jgi:hypothetical protein